jgi:hypothetical protein
MKTLSNGCLAVLIILAISVVFSMYETRKLKGYNDFAASKDYAWNDTEVWTILRMPLRRTPGGGGWYYAVVAFKTGFSEQARILSKGLSREVPEKPVFVSGKDQAVVYRWSTGDVTLDLSNLDAFPLRSTTSSQPIRALSGVKAP